MTKKQKQDTLAQLSNHSQKIIRRQQQVTNSTHKKSIRKPQQQLDLTQKIDLLKDKSQRLYKHAERKIDRMIEIIEEIDEKHLEHYMVKNGSCEEEYKNPEVNHGEAIKSEEDKKSCNGQHSPSVSQKGVVNKALTQLHNLLTYEKPLSHIKHQFQSFYSKLSGFSKDLEGAKQLPEDKKFLIPQKGLSFEQTRLIEQLIKEHYLRAGYFKVAQLFDNYGKVEEEQVKIVQEGDNKIESPCLSQKRSKKKQRLQQPRSGRKVKSPKKSPKKRPKVQLLDWAQNFKQCFILRQQLLKRNFNEAINWCVQERLYQTHSNPLQYELRLAEIRLLLGQGRYDLAYEKISRDMGKFLDSYQEEINLLIGYLLFSCQWNPSKLFTKDVQIPPQQPTPQQQHLFNQIITQRYSHFHTSTLDLQQLAQKFTHQYFIHYDISQFDTLEICYKVGKQYQQKYFDSIKMFSEKEREQFLKHKVHCAGSEKLNGQLHSVMLPFEINVDKHHMYHSIFVCPVTKEVLSSNDGVEFLSCGHLVSQSAKKSMAEVRRSNHKQKCPVCQKDRTSEVVKVSF